MDLVVVPDPVFWATLLATVIPFVTALLTRYSASSGVKATVATILAVADALLVSWKDATDAGVAIDLKTLVVALFGALTWQRVIHSQVNKPYRVGGKLLPETGLGASPRV